VRPCVRPLSSFLFLFLFLLSPPGGAAGGERRKKKEKEKEERGKSACPWFELHLFKNTPSSLS
jgi:hypothetical protein